jgi:hypothetical protein
VPKKRLAWGESIREETADVNICAISTARGRSGEKFPDSSLENPWE